MTTAENETPIAASYMDRLESDVRVLLEGRRVSDVLTVLADLMEAEWQMADDGADDQRAEAAEEMNAVDATDLLARADEQAAFGGEWLDYAEVLRDAATAIADLESRDTVAEIGQ